MYKKILSVCLSVTLALGLFSGCSGNQNKSGTQNTSSNDVYFLNFKPEIAKVYEEIAKKYENETGRRVKVVTAASGKYEETLQSEIAKSDAPTIFQINGPVGYAAWKDYCADLKDAKLYSYLLDKDMAISSNGGVYGIPYVVEGYGIIYNDAVMKKYFALNDKAVKINSADEINTFEKLKAVAEDMTRHKDKLGIEGVFSSTSLKSGEDWRWQTHLANIPLYYEFGETAQNGADTVTAGLNAEEIAFKYEKNFKNIFDLYTENSVTSKTLLGSKSVDDSMAEFALGKSAMVQNGNWAWSQINDVKGNKVKADDVKFLPIYTGVKGEENQGLCVGTENYLAVNAKASDAKQKASIEFLDWLFSSDTGKKYVVESLGFIPPFNTFNENEQPADPLAKEVVRWMSKKDIKSVPWTFAAFPSQTFKDAFGAALLKYVQGNSTWEELKTTVINNWKTEKAAGVQ